MKNVKNQFFLLKSMVWTDIKQRYQGSVLGLLWTLISPILMLIIYAFVFSEIFSAKWDIDTGNKFSFALMLFCGLSLYNMFSGTLGRCVGLINQYQNFVKKIVFPLEVLPLVVVFSLLFDCLISIGVLIIAKLLISGMAGIYMLEAPLILLPHILFCIGCAFLFSAISVYLKDIASFIPVFITICMYASPVFFPISAVPEKFRNILQFNPMTYSIENMRRVLLYGQPMEFSWFLISVATSLVMAGVGLWVFRKAKKGFADLL